MSESSLLVDCVTFAVFRNKDASKNDNLSGKERKVIRTARGFLMTVIDSC